MHFSSDTVSQCSVSDSFDFFPKYSKQITTNPIQYYRFAAMILFADSREMKYPKKRGGFIFLFCCVGLVDF